MLISFIEKILHIKEIDKFLENYKDKTGIDFIDEVFEMLNFSFTISHKDIKKNSSEGRLICVSNNPIGSLDSLSLIKLIYEIRTDVKIIANDILPNIGNINSLLTPFKLDSKTIQRENVTAIGKAYENCIDGLILVDIKKIMKKKKEQYINYFAKQGSLVN